MEHLSLIVFCAFIGVMPFLTLAQPVQVIKIPTKYLQEGVIFDASTDNAPIPLGSVSRFTPSLVEITVAEDIINAGYTNQHIKLENCYRQYFGYLDEQGNRVVVVQLINSHVKKKERAIIEDWKTESMSGFGAFFEKNVRKYFVEVVHKKLL
ncbi:hypothetical protein G8759_25160 [Spirosoma aureum]|uniref:Uncharacterized protein n=1 Tax=Spirosoma aureum TaxID=2692134 RepID=A0A6G9ATN3_9BACT|nr:hypothetical protein [Spirosoma aureum]QIP15686.1 hypothetical protein G8759_25160 [Spirosoma aureum]